MHFSTLYTVAFLCLTVCTSALPQGVPGINPAKRQDPNGQGST